MLFLKADLKDLPTVVCTFLHLIYISMWRSNVKQKLCRENVTLCRCTQYPDHSVFGAYLETPSSWQWLRLHPAGLLAFHWGRASRALPSTPTAQEGSQPGSQKPQKRKLLTEVSVRELTGPGLRAALPAPPSPVRRARRTDAPGGFPAAVKEPLRELLGKGPASTPGGLTQSWLGRQGRLTKWPGEGRGSPSSCSAAPQTGSRAGPGAGDCPGRSLGADLCTPTTPGLLFPDRPSDPVGRVSCWKPCFSLKCLSWITMGVYRPRNLQNKNRHLKSEFKKSHPGSRAGQAKERKGLPLASAGCLQRPLPAGGPAAGIPLGWQQPPQSPHPPTASARWLSTQESAVPGPPRQREDGWAEAEAQGPFPGKKTWALPPPRGVQEGQRVTAPSLGRAGGPEGHSPQPGNSRRDRERHHSCRGQSTQALVTAHKAPPSTALAEAYLCWGITEQSFGVHLYLWVKLWANHGGLLQGNRIKHWTGNKFGLPNK